MQEVRFLLDFYQPYNRWKIALMNVPEEQYKINPSLGISLTQFAYEEHLSEGGNHCEFVCKVPHEFYRLRRLHPDWEPEDAVELAMILRDYIKTDWSIEYNSPIITYETSFEELMGGV